MLQLYVFFYSKSLLSLYYIEFATLNILCFHLWWGCEVDDALQLHLVSKLLHQEGVPVLVNCPLCRVDATQLKHVQGKDVSDRTESQV